MATNYYANSKCLILNLLINQIGRISVHVTVHPAGSPTGHAGQKSHPAKKKQFEMVSIQ